MKLLVATTNLHKLEEIRHFLNGENLELLSLLDFPGYPDVVEDGRTFAENAVKKAVAYHDFSGILTLADDSGIEIDALQGQPGVRSARFAGLGASSKMLCNKVLGLLSCYPWTARTARFRCVMALVGADVSVTMEGRVDGYIANQPYGEQGFGYDPIFYYPALAKTFAEISQTEKNGISHRGQALQHVKCCLKNIRQ